MMKNHNMNTRPFSLVCRTQYTAHSDNSTELLYVEKMQSVFSVCQVEPRPAKKPMHWKVPVSKTAENTFNPIRNVVDTMVLEPNPDMEVIRLTIGMFHFFPQVCVSFEQHDDYLMSSMVG